MLGARLEYYVGVFVNSLVVRILNLVRVADDLNFLVSIYYFCCRIPVYLAYKTIVLKGVGRRSRLNTRFYKSEGFIGG